MTKNFQSPSIKITQVRDSAIEAATAAGKILIHYSKKDLKIHEKPGAGLVTNADIAAEKCAVQILRKKFPHFGFLTEESTVKLQSKSGCPGRWIIDPLDGTTNYIHRFPMFCVSIAAEWEGQIVVGVIYHPILKDLYVAVQGKGATLNGKSLHVSKTQDLKNALLTTGFTYSKKELLSVEMLTFAKLSSLTQAIRRPGSAALDLAYTARGVFDGFWERRLSPWDIAAGALLVLEAGGKVSDFHGNPFDVHSGEILASNSKLHEALLKGVTHNK